MFVSHSKSFRNARFVPLGLSVDDRYSEAPRIACAQKRLPWFFEGCTVSMQGALRVRAGCKVGLRPDRAPNPMVEKNAGGSACVRQQQVRCCSQCSLACFAQLIIADDRVDFGQVRD